MAVLLCLALGGWGFNAWQQSQEAPVRTHLENATRFVQEGRGADAEREWKEVVRLKPDDAGTWELLGDYYLTIGDHQAARRALEKVLQLKPDTPEIHYRLAVATVQLLDKKAARQHAEAELKQNPNHVGALDTITLALEAGNDEQSTGTTNELHLKYLRRLTELEPTNELYLSRLADGLVTLQRYSEARPVLEKLLKQNPEFAAARSLRGVVLLHTYTSPAELQSAAQDLRLALEQNPADVVAGQYLGKVYLRQRKPKEAILQLRKLDSLLTANPSYLMDLATGYQLVGDRQQATKLRQRYAALEQRTVAINRLKKQLSKNPQDFETKLNLGLLTLSSEQPVSAYKYLQDAQRMRPNDPRAKNALLRLEKLYTQHLQLTEEALQRRDLPTAGRQLSRAMLLLPTDKRTQEALRRFQIATGTAPNRLQTPSASTSNTSKPTTGR